MDKGEIWLTSLPEQTGKEQVGKRPALIIADTKTGLIIVIPFTSSLEKLKYNYTVEINPSLENALDKKSVALLFQMRAIDKKRVVHKIGKLEDSYLREIDENIKKLLKL